MLPKASRITSGADFDRIFKTGRKFYSAEAIVFVCPSEPGSAPRFGFIASKKVGNSVVRHQIARWLRETARSYIGRTYTCRCRCSGAHKRQDCCSGNRKAPKKSFLLT